MPDLSNQHVIVRAIANMRDAEPLLAGIHDALSRRRVVPDPDLDRIVPELGRVLGEMKQIRAQMCRTWPHFATPEPDDTPTLRALASYNPTPHKAKA